MLINDVTKIITYREYETVEANEFGLKSNVELVAIIINKKLNKMQINEIIESIMKLVKVICILVSFDVRYDIEPKIIYNIM